MNSTFLKDIAERIFFTAAGAFLAVFTVTDLSSAKAGLVAAAAAAVSLIKGLIASQVGTADTASLTV